MLGSAVGIVLKVQRVREMFHPWLPVYVKEPGHERTGHFYLFDATLGWRNVPNWTAKTRGQPLTINSRGLRDREYTLAKPLGVKRLLVLGDSFVWGYGVGDDDIFTEVLERRFESERRPWQVVNTGVSGWGTDQQYLFLKNEGLSISPTWCCWPFTCSTIPRKFGSRMCMVSPNPYFSTPT